MPTLHARMPTTYHTRACKILQAQIDIKMFGRAHVQKTDWVTAQCRENKTSSQQLRKRNSLQIVVIQKQRISASVHPTCAPFRQKAYLTAHASAGKCKHTSKMHQTQISASPGCTVKSIPHSKGDLIEARTADKSTSDQIHFQIFVHFIFEVASGKPE